MANLKITSLGELTTVADGDKIPIVDVSDLTQAPTGSTKYITTANLQAPADANLSTHAALATGTHGVGTSVVASALDITNHHKETTIFTPRADVMTARISKAVVQSQHVVAVIGDSWMTPQNTFQKTLSTFFKNNFGNATAGTGYRAFASSGVTGGLSVALAGTWTTTAAPNGHGATCNEVTSTDDVTGTLTITGTAETIVIHYLKCVDGGTFAYAVDGGGAVTIDTSAAASEFASVTISGLTNASHTIVITVTVAGSAGVTLYGADAQLTSNGVRFHCLGVSGKDTADWITPTAEIWQAAIAALAPDLVIISLGTNDKAADMVPATFGSNLQTLITRIRAAITSVDIAVCTIPENGRHEDTYTCLDYAEEIYTLAASNTFTIVDWYKAYGTYATTAPLGGWANTAHPSASGYNALAKILTDRLYIKPDIPAVGSAESDFLVAGTDPYAWAVKTISQVKALLLALGTYITEHIKAVTTVLTSVECAGTIITNYGQGAADVYQYLPPAATGMNFTAVIGTAQALNKWGLKAAAGDKIYLDGVAGNDGEFVTTTPVAGTAIKFFSFRSGVGTWDWIATTESGTWAAEAIVFDAVLDDGNNLITDDLKEILFD